ncbi:MAG: hypothetical protein AB7F86_19365 [Bdellovibrionales bacterium]
MRNKSQLELALPREQEPDRNHRQGGRSFYFFDFDDNVAFLTTPIYLFHKSTGAAHAISSRELAEEGSRIGKTGRFREFHLHDDPVVGSFQRFRDREFGLVERVMGKRQVFLEDVAAALGQPDLNWKGPSWNCFYHAVFNRRPLALITARGHQPQTMAEGLRLMVRSGHLPFEPNYLGLFPVSHPEVQKQLGAESADSIPALKQKALRQAVEKAKQQYGARPPHRFGISDDDPKNIEWIQAEMQRLKFENPHMSFFVIQTHAEMIHKFEIFAERVEERVLHIESQLSLFGE